jgi:hypothetical protein
MKLYKLPSEKYINLDALVQLGEVRSTCAEYYRDLVCDGTFALVEKPLPLLMAVGTIEYGDPPSRQTRKARAMRKQAEKERAKLIAAWQEAKFNA